MPARRCSARKNSQSRPPRVRRSLWGTMGALTCSAVTLILPVAETAQGRDILRGGSFSSSANSANTTGTSSATTQTATQLRTNALDKLARTTQALTAVQSLQNQARAIAAAASKNNLGLDPNHPGKMLPNVPNGLTTGGLQVLSGGIWSGANAPKQTVANGQTVVNIKQTSADALLQWQTFNIGKNTTLNFNQSAGGDSVGKWIAFNEIKDPSGSPSQILGSIQAQGQVYVINSNGIIFGGASQVNVHALVASSLQINENLISRGLLNNPDDQFLFSALAQPAGSNGTPAFNPATPLTPNGENGDVVVQQGAQISAPTTADHVGGRVELIGPNVKNAGTISTPDGQTILAAGLQVGFTAHSSSDASLRGLDVFVGAIVDPSSTSPAYAGTAVNNGLIEALRGDVTIAGKTVNQNGFINSSTSVSYNGRIDLLANYGAVSGGGLTNVAAFLPTAAGTVTLGENSVMQILPEWDSTDTVVGTALTLQSQVNIQGKAIHLGVDSELFAPNANITMQAGDWKYVSTAVSGNSLPTDKFVFDKGQIYFDAGADVDVSGSMDVLASVTENIISVQLLGAQLANSPLQRAGLLHGQTIVVDIRDSGIYNGYAWVGTPLADASGYVGLIERNVGELTIGGGTVNLTAGDSVVMQSGSDVNVSGGYINYQGAQVSTTRLLGTDGYIYDIANATPDRTYAGIYTGTFTVDHSKWGAVQSYTSSLFQGSHYENSYDYGGSGGAINITAPSMALDGSLQGQTVAGSHQRSVLPTQSALDLVFEGQTFNSSYVVLPTSPTPPEIIFQQDSTQDPVAAFALDSSGDPLGLSADRKATVILSPDLVGKDGFGTLTINNSDGDILIPSGVSLTTAAGGSITFSAANLDIEGSVTAPGGKLAFTVYDFSPVAAAAGLLATPAVDLTRGNFTLGSTALLSTAGLVVDDRATAEDSNTLPMVDNGGSITIASYSADLQAGSTIDVSGGALVSFSGKKTYGTGGSISITAGLDPGINSILGGKLTLGSTLEGYAGGPGGSLTIEAPLIQVGGTSSNPDTLLLTPDFFSQGGFASFSLKGLGVSPATNEYLPGLVIAPGTVIAPQEQSQLLFPSATDGNQLVFEPEMLQVSQRSPVSLAFNAVDVKDPYTNLMVLRGDVVMGAGALINADPGASVSLSGDTVSVNGSIYAPGGSITVTGGSDSSVLFLNNQLVQKDALATVLIGANSVLSTAGTTVLTPDVRGYKTGSVLNGGSISITGNIVAQTGSVLDVSGTSDVLDYNAVYVTGTVSSVDTSFLGYAVLPVEVDSNGGSITLTGKQSLFTDATLRGAAGGASAVGGSLTVSSGIFTANGTVQTPTTITVVASQNGQLVLAGSTGIGQAVRNGKGEALAGAGHFGVNQFETSGMSSLTLGGVVDFSGPVNITADSSLNIASGGFIYSNSAVTLIAPYVKLGTAFQTPLTAAEIAAQESDLYTIGGVAYGASADFAGTFGTGSLTVEASLIDVGNLALKGIGNLNLIANGGDIRGDGTLDVAGNIYLQAGQIYPPSAVSFTIAAEDYTVGSTAHLGSVTIVGDGTRQLPLSAGGELNVYGSIINQGGTLRAPLGVINIGTDGSDSSLKNLFTGQSFATTQKLRLSSGSVTSVSAVDPVTGQALVIPYGLNLNGISWIDPTGTDITAGGVVSKSVNLSAAKIFDQKGAEIDLRGGGDLYAYRFVSGTGGTHDILDTNTSFAVIPAYQANYSPYAPYNGSSTEASNIGSDGGYVNSTLKVGDVVYLAGGDGLAAGYYTLLPAHYALLPGAYLVTPQSGLPVGNVSLADGTGIVSGYRVNDLDASRSGALLNQRFLVASGTVVHDFAEYDNFSANTFLEEGALKNNTSVPRLPTDSGQLVLEATQAMTIQGSVASQSVSGGKGSLVDISSPVDIVIAGKDFTGGAGELVLNAADLSAIGAESLLIGGVRSFGTNGTTVTVQTGNVTVDNAGTPLSGADIILVANDKLTLDAGAEIIQSGTVPGGADTLLLGSSSTAGSGDGALLRLSSDPNAKVIRSGVDITDTSVSMVVGAGVQLTGSALTLDSTYATSLDSSAHLDAQSITLGSGSITIELNNPGTVAPTAGLDISGQVLSNLEAAQSLSLLSYSSINIYGTGSFGNAAMNSLSLHAAEIAGYNTAGGTVQFTAQNILLDNSPGVSVTAAAGTPDGTLTFNAGTIQLGANALALDQYATVNLNATGGILTRGSGSLTTQGALVLNTPLLTGTSSSKHTITAAGALDINVPAGGGTATVSGGLGASLTLVGQSVDDNGSIVLSSGNLTLHATGGDLLVGDQSASLLSVAGVGKQFFDLTEYTSGGKLSLISDTGTVNVFAGSKVDVSAQSGGGNAGTLTVSAPDGQFLMNGKMSGQGGTGGTNGSFNLDVSTLVGGAISSLSTDLVNGGFTQSLVFQVRNGDVLVDGTTTAHSFDLSTDAGSIVVSGTIDASGTTGGSISLESSGSLTLESGAVLTVAAQNFSDSGKGGSVTLEAGDETNGTYDTSAVLDLQSGSKIDLSVASETANSAVLGDVTGTLHLRAPQLADNSDLQINPIDGTIVGASSIVVEGYKIFDLTGSGGTINSTVESNVNANGVAFTGNTAAITARLLANNSLLSSVLHVQPGAEIINTGGDLTLTSSWDLSNFRYGPNANSSVRGSGEAGNLTLRASGNLVFNFLASLSDGFDPTTGTFGLWDAKMLGVGSESWSYRLVAGSDFGATDYRQVISGNGSVLIGKGATALSTATAASRSSIIKNYYQTIRTGTGDIDIYSGGDVQLLNPLVTIYTAGSQVAASDSSFSFDTPVLSYPQTGPLGSVQTPIYGAQYSMGGGNITISADNDIARYVLSGGVLVADSSKEMPTNWLYRRGFMLNGNWATNPTAGASSDVQSTSWWVDFSNFFQDVGALGGGDVTLAAGGNVSNVDAVVATNGRMPKTSTSASDLRELGGGDLVVSAGKDIDGGVYYVERGTGTLNAGDSIHTNSTRAALSQSTITSLGGATPDSTTWLPTTLFVGQGSFNVSANGDILLGAVANPFLLPQGMNNGYLDKTYFSTYATSDAVNVSSLTGNITLKDKSNTSDGSLASWYQNVLINLTGTYGGTSQPWLRLVENDVTGFTTNFSLMPSTLKAVAYSGNINMVGDLTLSPSATGTIDLVAANSVNGLQKNGLVNNALVYDASTNPYEWATSAINLSDADPNNIPGVAAPLSLSAVASGFRGSTWAKTQAGLFDSLDALFNESGSTTGDYAVIQTQQALHAAGLLHANDNNPVHLFAADGSISGLTLYAGKSGQVIAGLDITDIALYLQNNSNSDTTLVDAGRDLIAYDLNSPLRLAAQTTGNLLLNFSGSPGPSSGNPDAGDIQIGGPGTLEVLAGRDFNLGVGSSAGDGTGVGISSIGNARNPYLPFDGADVFAGAGLGAAAGLDGSSLNFTKFISEFLNPGSGGVEATRYLPDLASLMDLSSTDNQTVWSKFRKLSQEQQDQLALQVFYLVLRDAGRDFNNATSVNFGTYTEGYAAIAALFPGNSWQGDMSLTSREIKTNNGGNISIFAPGGQLTVGYDLGDNQPTDQGILTEHGGSISIFTDGDVNVGTSRIFTLRGGDEVIWSTHGNIAAGAASKTVQSAPPTRVLIDPQSGDVQTDLSGLATGGGIGVLESVTGVPPGNVDLIAPSGIIDAGDAGIRVSGNLNLAAVQILNASNIQVSGTSVGAPAVVSAPNISGALTSAAAASGAASSAADDAAKQAASNAQQPQDTPSIITVEVLGFGDGA